MKYLSYKWLIMGALFFYSCAASKKEDIADVILYNTKFEDIKNKNLNINYLKKYKSKYFNDTETLEIINRREKMSLKDVVWKGKIYGVLVTSKQDSLIIEVSRYGGFFKDTRTNTLYSFSEKDRSKWQKKVDDFISSSIEE